MGVKFSHFAFKDTVKKNTELVPSDGGVEPWGRVPLGWSCVLILGFNEASSSKERDFATVAGSAAGHLPLSHLADRWNVLYQLQSTTEFPSLQRFPQSLALVSPLCPTLHSIPLSRCVWMGNRFGIGFKSCQLHSIQQQL